MSTIYERLLTYFDSTPEEQIKKDWEATAQFSEIDSPDVEDFLENTNRCYIYFDHQESSLQTNKNLQTLIKNPKFTSDFSF